MTDLWKQEAATAVADDPLAGAAELIRAGVPVFVAPPDPTKSTGYRLPVDWQRTEADLSALERWRHGWAVCAVMGHTLDVLDVDPRNGGDESLAGLADARLIPRVYAKTATPSGGRHLFIAALGLPKATPWAGIDYQAGGRDGRGRGFVFLPPTARVPKGQPDAGAVPYTWTAPPDAEHITVEAPGDDTGIALACLVREAQRDHADEEPADVPHDAYDAMAEPDQERVRLYLDGVVTSETEEFRLVATWPEDHTDETGRGWQKRTADLANRLGRLARADWTPWTLNDARAALARIVPPAVAADVPLDTEWRAQHQRRSPAPFPRALAPATVLQAQPAVGPETVDEFWQARESLATIHQHARAVRLGPWALLGRVLALVVAHTPPAIRLPKLVGSHGSLNLFVALVGGSGDGKGVTAAAAADVLAARDAWAPPASATPGSGEGIAHAYAHREKGEVVRHATSVLFDAPEVDTLSALTERKGTTLAPELRKAWSGEQLGFSYADRDKRLPIEAHSYRMALVLGVQPERARNLMADHTGGTPQRFVFLPVTDPDAPDDTPPVPEPLRWSLPRPDFRHGAVVLTVCAAARAEVDADRVARLRGQGVALEAHALYARLKLGAALALLEGRLEVTDEDWHLAGVVMAVSRHTREMVAGAIAAETRRADEFAADRQARRETRVRDTLADAEDERVQRVARWAVTWLTERGPTTGGDLRRACKGRDRPVLDEALDRARDAGQVRAEDIAGQGTPGKRWSAIGAA